MESLPDTGNDAFTFKNLPRAAVSENQILLFRLRKNPETSTGYSLEYRLSFGEPYYAISHSWTDRTGSGDSIVVPDLAPWPLTLSPAKLGFLDWLYWVQDQEATLTEMQTYQISWFWMDLFCIDQAREDEELFSKQLQQIPQVFGDATACLAILASWPCEEAMAMPEPASTDSAHDASSDVDYDAVKDWLDEHLKRCSCPPLIDAWLTRVWTRQELLYSKSLVVLTANVWLSAQDKLSKDIWVQKPRYYTPPIVSQALNELSSCLITWATKNRQSANLFTSANIANMTRAMIRGQPIGDSFVPTDLPKASFAEWFSLNWTMILNGSIRYTTHRRDAIISQMLLVPGYQVPQRPWSMSIEAIAGDAASQFRKLLRSHQLVATIIDLDTSKAASLMGRPTIEESFNERGGLTNILHAAGTPLTIPKRFVDPERIDENGSELMVYRPSSHPMYLVLDEIDVACRTLQAAHHILGLATLWAKAADCRISWNVRACLKEIKTLLLSCESDTRSPENLLELRRALKHCLGCMTGSICFQVVTIPRQTAPWASKFYSAGEVDEVEIPRAFLATVRYEGATLGPHSILLWGNLNLGQEGEIWCLGVSTDTMLEHGIAVVAGNDHTLRPSASGALLPTDRWLEYKRIVKGSEMTDIEVFPVSKLYAVSA